MGIIREELQSVKKDLNSHIISRSHNSGLTGRPSCMYHLPHLYDKQDCVKMINREEIEEFYSAVGELPIHAQFFRFCENFIPKNGIKTPKNHSEALKL